MISPDPAEGKLGADGLDALPGRCGCGFHVEIQGHHPDCYVDIHGIRCLPVGCCVRCGRVGTRPILAGHDCSGQFVVEPPRREQEDGHPKTFEELWGARKPRKAVTDYFWKPRRKPALPPRRSRYDNPAPTSAKLAGILRKVANTGEGNRNNCLHWAACTIFEGGYPLEAVDMLAEAARDAGLPDPEIWRTIQSAERRTSP